MFLGGRKTRCHKVRGMLSEYIDNRLDSGGRGVVERHLGTCEACSNELGSLQMTVQLLHQVPAVPAPRSFAIRGVETSRASIFDLRSLGWLRPATALATVALIALLMVDFLQVVPHEVGTGEGEIPAYTIEARSDGAMEPVPEPAPALGEKPLIEDVGPDELGPGAAYDGESAAGWPLRQIEIAMGVLVFVLVALMFFARRRRRRWSRI